MSNKKDFGKMVKEFGKNWKTITDTANKKKKFLESQGYKQK
tara:strand:- start:73 stop:195 length:123 start_codon:yes stop_codon:yes gene_type:complete